MKLINIFTVLLAVVLLGSATSAHAQTSSIKADITYTLYSGSISYKYPCIPETTTSSQSGPRSIVASIINWFSLGNPGQTEILASGSGSASPTAEKCIYPTSVTNNEVFRKGERDDFRQYTGTMSASRVTGDGVSYSNTWDPMRSPPGLKTYSGLADEKYSDGTMAPTINMTPSKGSYQYTPRGSNTVINFARNYRALFTISWPRGTLPDYSSLMYTAVISYTVNKSYPLNGELVTEPFRCNNMNIGSGTFASKVDPSGEYHCTYTVTGIRLTPGSSVSFDVTPALGGSGAVFTSSIGGNVTLTGSTRVSTPY